MRCVPLSLCVCVVEAGCGGRPPTTARKIAPVRRKPGKRWQRKMYGLRLCFGLGARGSGGHDPHLNLAPCDVALVSENELVVLSFRRFLLAPDSSHFGVQLCVRCLGFLQLAAEKASLAVGDDDEGRHTTITNNDNRRKT